MKPGQQKQKEKKEKTQRKRKKEFRKPMVEEEIEIARIVEEKKEEEEDLIEIRVVGEIIFKKIS